MRRLQLGSKLPSGREGSQSDRPALHLAPLLACCSLAHAFHHLPNPRCTSAPSTTPRSNFSQDAAFE
jgi:hypothetical protein